MRNVWKLIFILHVRINEFCINVCCLFAVDSCVYKIRSEAVLLLASRQHTFCDSIVIREVLVMKHICVVLVHYSCIANNQSRITVFVYEQVNGRLFQNAIIYGIW